MAFGIYIHWPFCASKCPYCDFNSHVAAEIDHARWTRAYLSELDRLAAKTGPVLLSTVFFGGGTPSLMDPESVAAILERIRRLWPMVNDPEITLEANPGSVEAGRFAAFADAGVGRVSLGVQALEDDALRRLGRLHSAAEARRAFDIARAQFPRVSFDLIYARQDQDASAWRLELAEALAMAADHLSLYQLTIEDGTVFAARHAKGGLHGLPSEDRAVALWEITQAMCEAAGLPAYEVSNHARPGAESRHNLLYWRGDSWGGIGPGAHGRLGQGASRIATEAISAPIPWLTAVETGRASETREPVDARAQAEEYVMMSLRLSEGMERVRFAELGGNLDAAALSDLSEAGMIWQSADRIGTTSRGRLLLNRVTSCLLSG